uniref:Helix-turn-helix domain-containing protein n=1 Tax=uncultured prokaryote TaxID=198431 RepID=A0A0H5Q3K3_9ZZZZ|nr:hypothetical protein [uncultured prokaryote]
MNNDYLTAEQAAERARVSRPTISRALKYGDLAGLRDNRGRWAIKPDDVDAWVDLRSLAHNAQRAERESSADDERVEQLRSELSTAREALARAEGENVANKDRIADLLAERNRLFEMLEAKPTIGAGGFWSRLWARN